MCQAGRELLPSSKERSFPRISINSDAPDLWKDCWWWGGFPLTLQRRTKGSRLVGECCHCSLGKSSQRDCWARASTDQRALMDVKYELWFFERNDLRLCVLCFKKRLMWVRTLAAFVQAVLALNLWGLPWRSTLLLRPLTKLVPQCEDRCSEPIQNKYFFLLYSQTANAWKNTALLCMLLAYSVEGPAGESVLSQYSTRHIKRCSFGQKQY